MMATPKQSMQYLGSKAASGAYQAIISIMPPHEVYIETHLGSGAVFLNKPRAACSIVNDLNAECLCAIEKAAPGAAMRYQQDARDLIANFDYAGSGRTLIYVDPPYLPETRTSRARYKFEYTVQDHVDLIDVLKRVPANIIISGYPSSLYDRLLAGWNSLEFQAMTRGGVRTEKVWFNYEIQAAFSPVYAGLNFTDRQRIKRKAQRWADDYASMPPGEQAAILQAILTTHAKG